MPRGGLRAAANGSLEHLIKPKWKAGPTRTIRVPIAISQQLLEYAHKLDDLEAVDLSQDNIEDLKAKADLAKILLERCEYLEQQWNERESLITNLRMQLGKLGRKIQDQEQAIFVLRAALDLKANAGGAIKTQIKKALELLEGGKSS